MITTKTVKFLAFLAGVCATILTTAACNKGNNEPSPGIEPLPYERPESMTFHDKEWEEVQRALEGTWMLYSYGDATHSYYYYDNRCITFNGDIVTIKDCNDEQGRSYSDNLTWKNLGNDGIFNPRYEINLGKNINIELMNGSSYHLAEIKNDTLILIPQPAFIVMDESQNDLKLVSNNESYVLKLIDPVKKPTPNPEVITFHDKELYEVQAAIEGKWKVNSYAFYGCIWLTSMWELSFYDHSYITFNGNNCTVDDDERRHSLNYTWIDLGNEGPSVGRYGIIFDWDSPSENPVDVSWGSIYYGYNVDKIVNNTLFLRISPETTLRLTDRETLNQNNE